MAATNMFTIGHSTHPIEEFLAILSAHQVTAVADIRTVPESRHNPQFGQGALGQSLSEAGLQYQRISALGGLRYTRKSVESINGAWRNASFRAYADYMQTPSFTAGLQELLDLAAQQTVALMCAEAVPWRCHRSLVADALLIRGVKVNDIMSARSAKPHVLTSFAHVEGEKIWYPQES